MAIGLGVAVANGSPVAHADDTAASSPASTHDTGSTDGNTGDGGNGAGNEAHEPGGPSGGGQPGDDDQGDLGANDNGQNESGDDDDEDESLTDDLDDVTATPSGGTAGGHGGQGSGSAASGSVAPDEEDVTVEELRSVAADDADASNVHQQQVPAPEQSPSAELTPTVPEPAQDLVVTDPPPAQAPIGTVVSGALGSGLVDTAIPSTPSTPVAPPTVNEFLLAAYRPAQQRSQVNVQTTSLTTATNTPPMTLAAAASSILARIGLGSGIPYVVVTSPDGKRTYVVTTPLPTGGTPTSTVVGIDTATNQPVGEPVSVGYVLPSGFATSAKAATFNRDGSRFYVTSLSVGSNGQVSNTITVFNTSDGQVIGSPITTNRSVTGIVVSPDGRRLYTANSDSSVSVVDLQTNTVVDTIPIGVFAGPGGGGGSLDIVISQDDAQTVYISDYVERAVYVLDPVTDTVDPDPVLVNGYPVSLALSPDGKRLFVNTMTYLDPTKGSANQASVVIVDTATKAIVGTPVDYGSVSQGPATNGVMVVSPDGRYVYTLSGYLSSGGAPTATLWKIDTTSGTVQMMVDGLTPSTPVLSPDGKRIYVQSVTVVDGAPQLAIGAVSTSDNSIVARIPIDSGALVGMSVSPNGSRLYLGQVFGAGGDPADLTGQLTVVDTGTSSVVTPQRPVNPITLIIRNVTRTINASLQTIKHAINQTADSVARFLSAMQDSSLSSLRGLQRVGEALGRLVQAEIEDSVQALNDIYQRMRAEAARLARIDAFNSQPRAPWDAGALFKHLDTAMRGDSDKIHIDEVQSSIDGPKRIIVYIGGTEIGNPSQGFWKNLPSYGGRTKQHQIDMINAVVGNNAPNTEIMLVGYSQGGLDAQNLAEAEDLYGWNVTTVVTYGTPITKRPTAKYRVIHFQEVFDPIPDLGTAVETAEARRDGNIFERRAASSTIWNIFLDPTGMGVHANPASYENVGWQFELNGDSKFKAVKDNMRKFEGKIVNTYK